MTALILFAAYLIGIPAWCYLCGRFRTLLGCGAPDAVVWPVMLVVIPLMRFCDYMHDLGHRHWHKSREGSHK